MIAVTVLMVSYMQILERLFHVPYDESPALSISYEEIGSPFGGRRKNHKQSSLSCSISSNTVTFQSLPTVRYTSARSVSVADAAWLRKNYNLPSHTKYLVSVYERTMTRATVQLCPTDSKRLSETPPVSFCQCLHGSCTFQSRPPPTT